MQKISFLLIGTSLYFIPTLTYAQCVATQDCETLGYTETSCNGGKGVKCPFGNFWACLPTKESICKEEGFTLACNETGQTGGGDSCNGLYKQCSCSSPYTWSGSACTCPSNYTYTCSGTDYAGGSGTACGSKYVACTCAPGYEWKDGACTVLNGAQGELYYCNGTVVGVKATGMDFYVAMQDVGSMNWSSANSQCASYVFCGSLKGTLPTLAQLSTIYNNKSSVNSLLSTNGGSQLTNSYYWSSTASGYTSYYVVNMSYGSEYSKDYSGSYYVRPISASR